MANLHVEHKTIDSRKSRRQYVAEMKTGSWIIACKNQANGSSKNIAIDESIKAAEVMRDKSCACCITRFVIAVITF